MIKLINRTLGERTTDIASLRASQYGRGRVILVSLFSPRIPEIPLDLPTNLFIFRFGKPKLVHMFTCEDINEIFIVQQ